VEAGGETCSVLVVMLVTTAGAVVEGDWLMLTIDMAVFVMMAGEAVGVMRTVAVTCSVEGGTDL